MVMASPSCIQKITESRGYDAHCKGPSAPVSVLIFVPGSVRASNCNASNSWFLPLNFVWFAVADRYKTGKLPTQTYMTYSTDLG